MPKVKQSKKNPPQRKAAKKTAPPKEDRLIVTLERFVRSWERIADALEGIENAAQTATARLWPERLHREAIISHVPTEEDKINETHGASDKPIVQWLAEPFGAEDEFVGERERSFIAEQRKRQAAKQAGNPSGS